MAFFCINCKSNIEPRFKACPFCGEPITDFLRRYLESPIDGKYQILSRLGIGGMGEVYKVLHVHLNAVRVIKLMRPAITKEEGSRERFLREARLATRIQSPFVASLFDFSTLDDGSHYMVWEFIEGTNLSELIRARGCLSPKYTAKLASQALLGLDAIHRAGVVHRDVSPENLMITHDEEGEERVKIIDLGIAKQWGDSMDDKTKTGIFVGKWKYCSPEHLGMLKEGERIDGRADLYSFGIVMYEMLTGVPPFIADTPHRYLLLHAAETPKPLRETNPGVTAGPELESLIFRSLEKDRAKRFTTAREFAKALEARIDSLDDTAAPPVEIDYVEESTEERMRVEAEVEAATLRTDETTGQYQETLHDTVDSAAAASRRAEEPTVPGATLDLRTKPALEEATVPNAAFALATLAGSAADEQTIPSAPLAAVTVESKSGEEATQRSFIPAAPTLVDETRGTAAPTLVERLQSTGLRRWPVLAGIAAAAVLLIVLVSMLGKSRSQGEIAPATVEASTVARPQTGRLALNAYPWGEVLSIRNLSNGQPIAIDDRIVTPAAMDLPPGRYEVVLANPAFSPSTQSVTLSPGDYETVMVQFETPKDVPRFEGNYR